ncbi:hypothetical protein CSKR_202965 [Clonorchis sinensis]|uniref:Uncharacterized protein n=1 Tax=Clonorchis sinensis TaxID=79923 RepID=A0A8T1M6B2_CLOSI|nr:hypothetical protein CSKR_202965 [Clonorchis sinensis]
MEAAAGNLRVAVFHSIYLVPGSHLHGPPTESKLPVTIHRPGSTCQSHCLTQIQECTPPVRLTSFMGQSRNRSISVQRWHGTAISGLIVPPQLFSSYPRSSSHSLGPAVATTNKSFTQH